MKAIPLRFGAGMLAALLLVSAPNADTARSAGDDIAVTAQKSGDTVTVHTSAYVGVSPQETWAVLTDFDRMTEFITVLDSSKILSRTGNKLVVHQKGKASYYPLSFTFESVREIELKPHEEIRGHLIRGTMKKSEGVTRLVPEGEGTRIDSRAEVIPNVWIPPIIGVKIIERETRKQFQEIRKEILRRSRAKGAGS